MFGFIKQVFITLLSFSKSIASIGNASNLTTCISLINKQYMTQPTLINLNPN